LLGRLDQVGLNPQPLPPKELFGGSLLGRLDQVGLNPQPLPPKELFGGSLVSQLLDDFCGTVPKRLPPPPPPLGGGLFDTGNLNGMLDALRQRF
jgi:hypothetical protein